jgi:hypothetical protein
MRAFLRGLLLIIVALIAIPFVTGFILHTGSIEYFLAVVSASLLLASILLLIRARLSQAILLLALSVITFMSSKEMIHWDGYNPFFGSYYFGGMIVPLWLLILLVVLLVALAVRRN